MQKLHPKTFSFLKNITANNNREWFADHKSEYTEIRDQFAGVLDRVGEKLIKIDPLLTEQNLKASTKVFRIYRDARFSKDKTPYKTNFGGHIVPGNGREVHLPGYYIHIEQGNSFIGGGIWMPERMDLSRIRDYIHDHPGDLSKIVGKASFRKTFSDLNRDGALKTAPRGFEVDDPEIEWLRLKSFVTGAQMSQKDLMADDIVQVSVKYFRVLVPLVQWLRVAMRYEK